MQVLSRSLKNHYIETKCPEEGNKMLHLKSLLITSNIGTLLAVLFPPLIEYL